MSANWTWDGERPHQSQCPLAYMPEGKCLCMKSTDGSVHCMPAWQEHQCSHECPCFPSVVGYDDDGDLVWLHGVIS